MKIIKTCQLNKKNSKFHKNIRKQILEKKRFKIITGFDLPLKKTLGIQNSICKFILKKTLVLLNFQANILI